MAFPRRVNVCEDTSSRCRVRWRSGLGVRWGVILAPFHRLPPHEGFSRSTKATPAHKRAHATLTDRRLCAATPAHKLTGGARHRTRGSPVYLVPRRRRVRLTTAPRATAHGGHPGGGPAGCWSSLIPDRRKARPPHPDRLRLPDRLGWMLLPVAAVPPSYRP